MYLNADNDSKIPLMGHSNTCINLLTNSFLLSCPTFNSTLHFLFVDVFYVPSYLSGEVSSKGTFLEPWRGVDRPRDSQGAGMNDCLVSELAKEKHVLSHPL